MQKNMLKMLLKYAQYAKKIPKICKKYARNMLNMQKQICTICDKYAKIMREICRICKKYGK